MVRAVEGSLRRLNTDHIDLLWAHFPDDVTPAEEIVRGLDDLIRSGKILHGGLSNFPAWRISRAATIADLRGWSPIIGVQLEYSLVERSADRELLPMAEALGLGAALWSPLGGGLLTGKYRTSDEGRLTDWKRLIHTGGRRAGDRGRRRGARGGEGDRRDARAGVHGLAARTVRARRHPARLDHRPARPRASWRTTSRRSTSS